MVKSKSVMITSPIPNLSLGSWKTIPIYECGEKLVAVSTLQHRWRVRVEPMYFKQGVFGAIPEVYLRESLVTRITAATQMLSENMELVLWDGWRPLVTQKALFNAFKTQILSDSPDLSEEELIRRTSTYVSLPSADRSSPSPHNTGGSVDLTIAYRNGDFLQMGTDFDNFSLKARTTYYEKSDDLLDDKEITYRDNRRLLYKILTTAGFSNYPEEWWHFDYGNQFWASITGTQYALYNYTDLNTEN